MGNDIASIARPGQGFMTGGNVNWGNVGIGAAAAAPSIAHGASGLGQGIAAWRVNEANADLTRKLGRVDAQQIETANRRNLGRTVAAYGASGVSLGSGTPQNVIADQLVTGAHDLLLSRFATKVRAQNYEDAATASLVQAGTSLLGGAGSGLAGFAGAWDKFDLYGSGTNDVRVGNPYDRNDYGGSAFA